MAASDGAPPQWNWLRLPSPLFQQYSCQCASHCPIRYIINNDLPIEQRSPGGNGEIIHWVKLGGEAIATCTPDRISDKQTMCKAMPMPVMACSCKAQAPLTTAQCLNGMPQWNASLQCLIHQCLNVMPHIIIASFTNDSMPSASSHQCAMPGSSMPNAHRLTHQRPMPDPIPNA